ncbi:MAG: hypothetical protein IT373_15690 [Polyangiaceae bacterium]|nr:hypothetical protein [Polyangiaceae bacterium]
MNQLASPRRHPRLSHRAALVLGLCVLGASACQRLDFDLDPRVGDAGRVRFTGGGCTSSVTLAVGASETFTIESASTAPLPDGLGALSESPEIIDVTPGEAPGTVDLRAHAVGESRLVVTLPDGGSFDTITFRADVARLVHYATAPRVFRGGTLDVAIGETYGACALDPDTDNLEGCRLVGHGFLGWSVEPPEAGAVYADREGTASLRTALVGAARIVGVERSEGWELVRHGFEVVSEADAGELVATATALSMFSDEPLPPVTLPGTIQLGDGFVVALAAKLPDGTLVPISRRDAFWRAEGCESVAPAPSSYQGASLDTLFLAGGLCTVALAVDVPFLGKSGEFTLTIAAP